MSITATLLGAVAMASLVVSLFFLKFWHQTRDPFFLLFAIAFALDAVTRLILSSVPLSSEQDPLVYFGRLVTYGLILAAVIGKNFRGR